MPNPIQEELIQVWGLWRSGTNFIEYLVRNNIQNHNYTNRYAYSVFTSNQDALKHTLPNISKAKYHICVYKPFDVWIESYNKDGGQRTKYPERVYYDWLSKVTDFKDKHPDRVALVNYNDFIGKELWYFRGWGWDITFNNIWQVPLKKMGKGGGTDFK